MDKCSGGIFARLDAQMDSLNGTLQDLLNKALYKGPYAADVVYSGGNIVFKDGQMFQSNIDNNNNIPPHSSWNEVTFAFALATGNVLQQFNVKDATELSHAVNLKQLNTKEDSFSNPRVAGMFLTSTVDGTRGWSAVPSDDTKQNKLVPTVDNTVATGHADGRITFEPNILPAPTVDNTVATGHADGRITFEAVASGGGGIGIGQSWVDETANRVNGTIYINNSGKPRVVSLIHLSSSLGNFSIDGITVATLGNDNRYHNYTAIVPDGSTYSHSTGIKVWLELK